METIEYKKPYWHNIFLSGMVIIIILLFWLYSNINPARLLTTKSLGAALFVIIAIIVFLTGIRKITYDGNVLSLRYGLWYTRKYLVKDIEKIEAQTRAQYVAILVYLKNGKKFSRGLTTSQKSKDFAQKLATHFN